jgi:hypothetical protein
MANLFRLKAWVRYDGKGRLVGGGPILQESKPKNGDWVEIPFYEYCCQHTTTTTSTSTTTTTTTAAPVYERASFINNGVVIFRGGTFTTKADMWAGNTIANITATNATYQISGIKSQELQVFRGEVYTFDFLANPSASPNVVVPTYTNTDSGGTPILLTLQDFYEYNKKIITNSFLSTRNPVINIFRATNPGYVSGIDGFFLVTIDFDATGLEQRAYNIDFREYQYVSFPGTVTYPTVCQLPLSANINATIPPQTLTLLPPSSGWTVGQTVGGEWIIQEIFTIPITW